MPFDDTENFKDPRMIQGCPPEMSVECGPHTRAFAKDMRDHFMPEEGSGPINADDLKAGRQLVYCCGLSAEEVGRKLLQAIGLIRSCATTEDDQVVFVEDDESRFDLHIIEGPCSFLAALYKEKLIKRVQKILTRTACSKGRTNGGIAYSVPYTMQSGWPDTSCGDSAVNIGLKIKIHGHGRPWVCLLLGDDSITVTLQSEVDRLGGKPGLIAAYTELGMEIEAVICDDVLLSEFCSMTFREVGGGLVPFPKVGKFLAKILCDDKPRNNLEEQLAWARGIGVTCSHFGRIDPLIAALSRGIFRCLGVGLTIDIERDPYKLWLDGSKIATPVEILNHYQRFYGYDSSDIAHCVGVLENIDLFTVCSDTRICHLVDVDIGARAM